MFFKLFVVKGQFFFLPTCHNPILLKNTIKMNCEIKKPNNKDVEYKSWFFIIVNRQSYSVKYYKNFQLLTLSIAAYLIIDL